MNIFQIISEIIYFPFIVFSCKINTSQIKWDLISRLLNNLTLIWMGCSGFFCDQKGVGQVKLPSSTLSKNLLCQKREILYASAHRYVVSENMAFSTKTTLVLQMSVFFKQIQSFWQNQYLYSKQQYDCCVRYFYFCFQIS